MARYHQLTSYHLARQTLRDVREITGRMGGFGDLGSQMRRAAVSVVGNICEGAATCRDRQFARYLDTARGSANELQAQLEILADLGDIDHSHPAIDRCDRIGGSITRLLHHLGG